MSDCATTTTTQLWKLSETAARKQGVRRSIYEINRKQNDKEQGSSPGDCGWEIGKTYTGEWSNDLRDGYGVQTWSNLSKYEGEWKCDQRNGYGVYWTPTMDPTKATTKETDISSIYNQSRTELASYTSENVADLLRIGEELKNTKIGKRENRKNHKNQKREKHKLHKQYEGEWRHDLKHGKGTFYYENGDKFEGVFSLNLRSGYGVMYYQNGDKYEGDWKLNKKNGFGVYVDSKDNTVYTGYWMNNLKEGPGYFRYNHQQKLYVAEWVNNTPNCGYFVDVGCFEESDLNKIPALGLKNSDSILSQQIKTIRSNRKLIRSLAIIDDIEDIDVHQDIKSKIVDIFEQITIPTNSSNQQCYVHKLELFESIQDFQFSKQAKFENQETMNARIASHCHHLGVGRSKKSKDTLIITLLDYAKIIYLLLSE